ncbi:MAG: class I SAM-dependent methyltransferase [Magnetospirillum sp. WYHS-4]
MSEFYGSYDAFKNYRRPVLKAKHVRRYDREFWEPMACRTHMAVLEIGCGTGLFLAYLKAKGVAEFLGIDLDPALAPHIPPEAADRFRAGDVRDFLAADAEGRRFDRVAMYDVLEHFTHEDGAHLLRSLGAVLNPGARVLVKVPNMGSPWGGQYQFGDMTHKAAYSPSSLRQLALACGFVCTRCLPHRLGSPSRQVFDRMLHGVLGRLVMTPPEIWSANVFAVFDKS